MLIEAALKLQHVHNGGIHMIGPCFGCCVVSVLYSSLAWRSGFLRSKQVVLLLLLLLLPLLCCCKVHPVHHRKPIPGPSLPVSLSLFSLTRPVPPACITVLSAPRLQHCRDRR